MEGEGWENGPGPSRRKRFADRAEAARLLAARLSGYRGRNPLVLGIPRGAVPMARVIADALEGEVDVVLVHKLGAPFQPEYAIGAVTETGEHYLTHAVGLYGIDASYIEGEVERELQKLRLRRAAYTPVRLPIDASGRIVIIVDDGIATGSTMLAALRTVRARKPSRLVAATAVAPPETVTRMEEVADDVVCLETPVQFFAVGQFFSDFRQVTDDEVIAALAGGARSPESSPTR